MFQRIVLAVILGGVTWYFLQQALWDYAREDWLATWAGAGGGMLVALFMIFMPTPGTRRV